MATCPHSRHLKQRSLRAARVSTDRVEKPILKPPSPSSLLAISGGHLIKRVPVPRDESLTSPQVRSIRLHPAISVTISRTSSEVIDSSKPRSRTSTDFRGLVIDTPVFSTSPLRPAASLSATSSLSVPVTSIMVPPDCAFLILGFLRPMVLKSRVLPLLSTSAAVISDVPGYVVIMTAADLGALVLLLFSTLFGWSVGGAGSTNCEEEPPTLVPLFLGFLRPPSS